MAKPKSRTSPKQQVGVPQPRNVGPIIGIVAVVLALVFAGAVLATAPWESDDNTDVAGAVEFQSVNVEGNPLPPEPTDGQPDGAVGTVAPELSGSTFTGEPIEIANDGRPKAVMFYAHWCPHCQRELPVVTDWLEQNRDAYPGVDFYSVSTDVRSTQPNFPPSEWFDDEGYSLPVMADSSQNAAANAFGLSGYPYMVFLDSENKVVSRVSSEVPAEQFTTFIDSIAPSE
jgi:cytochrome c biogenesis protein CcmG, thiol:disulfide interchange protein DsbE